MPFASGPLDFHRHGYSDMVVNVMLGCDDEELTRLSKTVWRHSENKVLVGQYLVTGIANYFIYWPEQLHINQNKMLLIKLLI